MPVPHRDEYSETVGWVVFDPARFFVLYMPDLDSWDEWEARSEGYSLEKTIGKIDMLFIDATFWDDNELPGRDMSAIPHPRVAATMDRLQHLPASERAKVHFIHLNHTNPLLDKKSEAYKKVVSKGYK